MITLHTYGSYFGLPDASPFVIKAEMLLKLAGLPYQTTTRGRGHAPKGKLPYLEDQGRVVPDSTLIRLYLERQYGIDFDRGLAARERGIAWATEKMLEDHLYWLVVYWRWAIDANFAAGPRQFFARAPALLRPLAIRLVRRRVRHKLAAHGMGLFDDTEKTAIGTRCIDALAGVLGDHRYLMGDTPCGADATAFAFIASALPERFDFPVRTHLANTPNLVAYRDRMLAEFFPALAK